MISWMQHHKKWLIVTIWIATIAFVGAGFVGWGAYSYSKSQSTVAKVNDIEISIKDLNDEYSKLFNEYNQKFFNGKLDNKTAKKLGLDKLALKNLIQNAIFMQFAKDNGLIVTDKEVADAIASMPYFLDKNGDFNKTMYIKILETNNITPEEFENSVRKDLLVAKIKLAITKKATNTTYQNINNIFTMQDKIIYKIIDSDKFKIKVTDKEVYEYWQKHKNNYLDTVKYKIAYVKIPIVNKDVSEEELKKYYQEHKLSYKDEDGKILSFEAAKEKVKKDILINKTKQIAIKAYKNLKKGKTNFKIIDKISKNNNIISQDLMEKIVEAPENKILKPLYNDNYFIIAKKLQTYTDLVLAFEQVKKVVKEDLIKSKKIEKLKQLSEKDFNSNKSIWISRTTHNVADIDVDNSRIIIQSIFDSNKTKGFVLYPELNPTKSFVYKIIDQKLLNNTKIDDDIINISDKIKEQEEFSSILKYLQNKYDIKIYYKGN